ncbi:MAG: glucokinase [Elusimicrobia bacterium]|nr:glucokinase [Elusimicrobiota bacterium]
MGKALTGKGLILAGDVGGTNTRLGLFRLTRGTPRPVALETFSSVGHESLEEIVRRFLDGRSVAIAGACIGVAGPVVDNRCVTANLHWNVDGRRLAAAIGVKRLALINDLVANAAGIACLSPMDFKVLNRGVEDSGGNRALISAGTGLGEAGLIWDGAAYRPIASEGGHSDFAPRSALEERLLRYLRRVFGHVSFERVVSGPGLHNLYRFLRDSEGYAEPHWLSERMRTEDPPSVVSSVAMSGRSVLCSKALSMFVSIYGAEAGNLALKFKATGGVYLGGGIAPKILPKLSTPVFLQAFRSKGRLSHLIKDMPVRVILNDKTALLGAASWIAARP